MPKVRLRHMTHTREAKVNVAMCEKKVSHFTSACFDVSSMIAQQMRDFSSDPIIPVVTVVVKRAQDPMLDNIEETTQGQSKTNGMF